MPPLTVDVQPSSVTILDASPYNTFTLICTASLPTGVSTTKTFEWMRSQGGVETTLTHNGNTIVITNQDLASPTSTGILTTSSETTAGTAGYTCTAAAFGISASDNATVLVEGQNIIHA